MNKYQEAYLKLLNTFNDMQLGIYDHDTLEIVKVFDVIQELVDKEKPLTPEYRNTKVEREHYLDKDYQMLYHCPKCDWIINSVRKYCEHCGQKLNWNKYYVIEEGTYYKRNE